MRQFQQQPTAKKFTGRSLFVAIAGQVGAANDTVPLPTTPIHRRYPVTLKTGYAGRGSSTPATSIAPLPGRGTVPTEWLTQTYRQLASRLSYPFVPDEPLVNRMGTAAL